MVESLRHVPLNQIIFILNHLAEKLDLVAHLLAAAGRARPLSVSGTAGRFAHTLDRLDGRTAP